MQCLEGSDNVNGDNDVAKIARNIGIYQTKAKLTGKKRRGAAL